MRIGTWGLGIDWDWVLGIRRIKIYQSPMKIKYFFLIFNFINLFKYVLKFNGVFQKHFLGKNI